jgi:hypothetical protein
MTLTRWPSGDRADPAGHRLLAQQPHRRSGTPSKLTRSGPDPRRRARRHRRAYRIRARRVVPMLESIATVPNMPCCGSRRPTAGRIAGRVRGRARRGRGRVAQDRRTVRRQLAGQAAAVRSLAAEDKLAGPGGRPRRGATECRRRCASRLVSAAVRDNFVWLRLDARTEFAAACGRRRRRRPFSGEGARVTISEARPATCSSGGQGLRPAH